MNYNYLILVTSIIILGVFVVNSHLTEPFYSDKDANKLKDLYTNINNYPDNPTIDLVYTLNKLNNECELIWTDTPSSNSYVIVGEDTSSSSKKSELTVIPKSNTTTTTPSTNNQIHSYKIKVKPNTKMTYTLYRYDDNDNDNDHVYAKSNSVTIDYIPFIVEQLDTSQACVKCYPDGTQETIACDACDSTRPFPELDSDPDFYKNNDTLKKKLTKKKTVSFNIS